MYSVLIVDDEKNCRQRIKNILRKSEVPIDMITECRNGMEALEVLESQGIDIMFTDICMPKMDGIALVRAMQKLPYKPITVAVSGHDDFSYAVEMMRMGVRDYILKPVADEQLEELIRTFEEEIRQKRMQNKTRKHIGYQQLKYLMQNDNISEKEIDVIIKQYQNSVFPEAGYYICCLEKQEYHGGENSHFIYLNDVWGNDLFVIDSRALTLFSKNELQNSFLGFSEIHFGLSGLKQAYEEAFLARKQAYRKMEHRVYCKKKESVTFLDEKGIEILVSSQTMEEEQMKKTAQLIGTDKGAQISLFMKSLKRDVYKGSCSLESFEKGIAALLQTITSTYQNLLKEEDMDFGRFENIYQYPCLEDFMEELTEWMMALQEKIHTQFDDYKNKQKIIQAVRYIEANYNKDLNMAVVSNYVSMNYSLFSYEFKQYTGVNFVSYVKKLRIEEAKKLLADTELRIGEISAKVGYENEKHFMKTFKSACGVSPGEYRKNIHFASV
ncbi:MAG: response regulator [Lachnospiraceae bacterium]|nr:response regulator [Lachnospiraceae bacterium]